MDPIVEREVELAASPEEVWESLADPAWLAKDASIELHPGGEVRAGDRSGFVEEADEPRRLAFWWGKDGVESTRVELTLEERAEGTMVRVAESRPLAMLDLVGADLGTDLGVSGSGMPEMLAA